MNRIETGVVSIKKDKEELCGDRVEIARRGGTVTTVLADGLGSGVKANILATLTSKILGTMMADGLDIGDAVRTVAHTLPVCSVRKIAYSTFSVLQVEESGAAYLAQFDNPDAILLRGGRGAEFPHIRTEISGKTVYQSRFTLHRDDMLLLLSDGVVHAGAGGVYNFGWQREQVGRYAEEHFAPALTPKALAALIAGACRQLYVDRPGDDATVAALRLRAPSAFDVLVGPPADPADTPEAVRRFLESDGRKVVCGGTTSQLVAQALGRAVKTNPPGEASALPPTASIEGVELVTEGMLTLRRTLTLARGYPAADFDLAQLAGDGAAAQLARLLLEEATDIRFFAGGAENPAYRQPGFPEELCFKPRLVEALAQALRGAGKEVSVTPL